MRDASFLGTQPVSRLLWKFSVPAITGTVITALYNVVDSIFVGQGIGELALTAVTVAFPVQTLLMAFGMLIGVGSANIISIRLGQGRTDRAEGILGNAFTLMFAIMVITTGVFLWYLDPLLRDFMGVDPAVLPYAHDFISIILLGSVFQHIGFGINNVIRAQGDPRTALETQIIAGIINVILNYLFVFTFQWGISGSALATVLAQAVAALWVAWYFIWGPAVLKLQWKYLRPRLHSIFDIVKIGCSPFMMQLAATAVMVVFNVKIQFYGGVTAVAAYGIINRLMMLIFMPVVGISMGAQPILGFNFGARKYDRVLHTLRLALLAATGVSVLGFIIAEVFPQEIIRIFNDSPDLLRVGTRAMRIYLVMTPVVGSSIIAGNYFQAVNKPLFSLFFTINRQVFFLIPCVYLFSSFLVLDGIWLAGAVSDGVAFIVTTAALVYNVRQIKKQIRS